MVGRLRRSLGTLRHFAATGAPPRMAFAQLVACLKDCVAFETAQLVLFDEAYRVTDILATRAPPRKAAARFVERWLNRDERRFYPTHYELQVGRDHPVFRVSDFTPGFQDTELYDEVLKSISHCWILGVSLKDGARPIGNLALGRPFDAPDFTEADMAAMRLARPFIIQAVSRTAALDEGWDGVADRTAVVVADGEGRIHRASRYAGYLLRGATDTPLADAVKADDRGWAQTTLRRLADQLRARPESGRTGPAVLETVTPQGRFILRAYALDDASDESWFVAQVERQVPLAVKLFGSPLFRDLSAREQTVCRLVVTGRSQTGIADDLDIAPSTVVTHVRNLYDRVGVRSRQELASAMLAPGL
ncbi:LuxR family transcriptional regulator [Phenylobacterium sp.]|uniref:helix-turn-helix transcriptional regulator n=1 Tax=Phenylobacterium sp. TaxID=1871053 RepID=UPI00120A6CB1|nr:LuxR family transcriptional regulator [Phenylobacterium sp.]THD63840.1 MAG: LuxR family transcriptional regulator [Phenylobacterium sp.]